MQWETDLGICWVVKQVVCLQNGQRKRGEEMQKNEEKCNQK